MHLRYAASAAYAELRQLAAPVSLDVGVLDKGVEDHSTAAPLSVRKADEALDLLADVLTIELLLAADVLGLRPELPALGAGTAALYGSARGAIAALVRPVHGRRPPGGPGRPVRAQPPDVEPGDRGEHEQAPRPARRARAARPGTPSPARSRSAAPAA